MVSEFFEKKTKGNFILTVKALEIHLERLKDLFDLKNNLVLKEDKDNLQLNLTEIEIDTEEEFWALNQIVYEN